MKNVNKAILMGNLYVIGTSTQCSHLGAKQKRATFNVFYLQNINEHSFMINFRLLKMEYVKLAQIM